MALALEGTPQHVTGSGSNTTNLPAFTTSVAARLFISVAFNDTAGVVVSGISGGGLTWTQRVGRNGTNSSIELWSAEAASAVAGAVFTITYSAAATPAFTSAHVFAFSGQDTSGTPFDGNGAVPASSATDPVAITTTNADDVIIAAYRESSTASPTAGTGFTTIIGADYHLAQYKIVAAPQTGLSCTQGTGAGDSNGCVADALKAAGGGGTNTVTIRARVVAQTSKAGTASYGSTEV